MAIPLIVNGVTFQYPQQFDKNWGPTLTTWSQAVTNGMLQKAGGTFTLTAEVDFGSSFGMKVKSIKSEETNIAATGFLRLANASAGIVWRNALNNADLPLTVNASNQLTFNGTSIGATTSLTDSHILVGNSLNQPADVALSGDATITNAGVLTIANSAVTNVKVSATAAIALSKLAATTAYYWYVANTSGVMTPQGVTASRAVVTDSNGLPTAATTTATEIGYVNGVTSAIQTQIDTKLTKSGDTMSGVLNMGSHKIQSIASGTNTGEAIQYGQWVGGQTPGTTGNDSASTGNIGEYVESISVITNAPASGNWGDLTSISLTPGDWDVTGLIDWSRNTSTWTTVYGGISTTSGNSATGLVLASNFLAYDFTVAPTNVNEMPIVIPNYRISIASTTTVYLKFNAARGANTPQATGKLCARRMR